MNQRLKADLKAQSLPRVTLWGCGVALRSGVIRTCAVFLVFGQLKAGTALARHPTFAWSFSADVGAAVVLVHAVHSICAGDRDRGTEGL